MLVRLPTRMHVPVELPRLSSLPLPPLSLSSTSVLLALLASLVLLATARAALLFIRPKPALGKPASVDVSVSVSEKSPATPPSSAPEHEKRTSSWGWGLLKWDTLPSLPLSLSARSIAAEMRGRGVGLRSGSTTQQQQQQEQQTQQVQSWQGRRGPAFARPAPALYQTDVPASMAKMIMSRHTFRRPTSRPPPRSSQTPQIQIQRRTPSMV